MQVIEPQIGHIELVVSLLEDVLPESPSELESELSVLNVESAENKITPKVARPATRAMIARMLMLYQLQGFD